MIEIRNLSKTYPSANGGITALKDINLTINDGEIFGIIGLSGAGKSTLMNVLGCMDKPDAGMYLLDGSCIGEAGEQELTKIRNEKIGFIFQKYHLIQTYNVAQNIVMPLLIRGKSLKEAEEDAGFEIQIPDEICDLFF